MLALWGNDYFMYLNYTFIIRKLHTSHIHVALFFFFNNLGTQNRTVAPTQYAFVEENYISEHKTTKPYHCCVKQQGFSPSAFESV